MVAVALVLPVLFLLFAVLVTTLVIVVTARFRFSVPGAQGADAGELRAYVRTFSRTLSTLGVSRPARRRHVDELKANLAESVAADGIRAALEGLGPAGALATGYADYRPRPAWLVGLAVAALTFATTLFAHLQLAGAYSDGWMDGVVISGSGVNGNGAHTNSLAVTFDWVARSARDIDVNVSSPWLWILPLAAFFIASRSWRVLLLRNAASVSV